MTRTPDSDWGTLADELAARVTAHTPDWTDARDSDPGVTLAELAAFLTESILNRPEFSARARSRLSAVLARLESDKADQGCADASVTRVHYFTGQLLGAADFEEEQRYVRDRLRRHNRLLHGTGVVRGLGVSLEAGVPGEDPVVVVSPGVAIAPDGDELILCDPCSSDLCPGAAVCYVTIGLAERPVGATPGGEPTRIEETAEIVVREVVPPGHLALARIARDGTGWRIDAG